MHRPRDLWTLLVKDWLKILSPIVAALILSAGIAFHALHVPGPAPASVDAHALGKAYGPLLIATYAAEWRTGADALEKGGKVSEIQPQFEKHWQEERVKAFTAKVAPELAKILPEGAEPNSAAQRAEVVKEWRAFADGLEGK